MLKDIGADNKVCPRMVKLALTKLVNCIQGTIFESNNLNFFLAQ
jgi:hypothetical protein